jgi:hypothetical protein
MIESKDEYARLLMMMTLTFLSMTNNEKGGAKMMRINDEPADVFSNGYFNAF